MLQQKKRRTGSHLEISTIIIAEGARTFFDAHELPFKSRQWLKTASPELLTYGHSSLFHIGESVNRIGERRARTPYPTTVFRRRDLPCLWGSEAFSTFDCDYPERPLRHWFDMFRASQGLLKHRIRMSAVIAANHMMMIT